MKKQDLIADENFYLNELNFYTTNYYKQGELLAKETNEKRKDYLKDYSAYCKEQIYYYSGKLTELKGEMER